MTDYLARSQSLAAIRSRSVEPRGSALARTYSVHDMGQYDCDRYTYYSPLHRTTLSPRSPYSVPDYYSDPIWSSYSSYWNRYKGSGYNRYLRYNYTPYHSHLTDSMSGSLARGLSMYRSGEVDYSTLNNYWLTPGYWDRRFKDWRDLYYTYTDPTRKNMTPTHFERRTREYMTTWNNKYQL